jgi:hypothetical protein
MVETDLQVIPLVQGWTKSGANWRGEGGSEKRCDGITAVLPAWIARLSTPGEGSWGEEYSRERPPVWNPLGLAVAL